MPIRFSRNAFVLLLALVAALFTSTGASASKHHKKHHQTLTVAVQPPAHHKHHHHADSVAVEPPERHKHHHHAIATTAADVVVRHHRHHHGTEVADQAAPLTKAEQRHHKHEALTEKQLAHYKALERLKQERIADSRENDRVNKRIAELRRIQASNRHVPPPSELYSAEVYREHLQRLAERHQHALAQISAAIATPKSIETEQDVILDTPIRVIIVDLNDPTVKVTGLMAQNGIGTAEPFASMIRRAEPNVAVTGTFFGCDNLRPVGDIVIDGRLTYYGGMGTALCITSDNKASMVRVPFGHHQDWSNYNFVMACGPQLLGQHRIVLDPTCEHFNQAPMLAPNSRIGVGITDNNKLIFCMTRTPILLGRLAKIMNRLGCNQAMNLDGGESVGFYCDGDMMARPGRWLTNAIVVYANQHPETAVVSSEKTTGTS